MRHPATTRPPPAGESRNFRTDYLEGPQYVPLLLRARELGRELEQETGMQVLNLNGGLVIGPENFPHIRNALTCVGDFDLPHHLLEPRPWRSGIPST